MVKPQNMLITCETKFLVGPTFMIVSIKYFVRFNQNFDLNALKWYLFNQNLLDSTKFL